MGILDGWMGQASYNRRKYQDEKEDMRRSIEQSYAEAESIVKTMNRTKYQKKTVRPETKIYSKIVGVTFGNCQNNIKNLPLAEGTYLQVIREANNPYDANAVALKYNDRELGHLSKEMARTVAPKMDAGKIVNVRVEQVTGGDGYNYGVNICVMMEE